MRPLQAIVPLSKENKGRIAATKPPWLLRVLGVGMLVWLLGGCVGKLPPISSFGGPERTDALRQFKAFRAGNQARVMDADIHLRWSVLGRQGSVDGSVQISDQEQFRLNMLDPLRRPLYIGVGSETLLTVIDIPAGRAWQGPLYGELWQEYVPAWLTLEQITALLLGQAIPGPVRLGAVGTVDGQEEQNFWITFRDQDGAGSRYRALFDPQQSVILEYILVNDQGEPGLSIRYSGYHWVEGRKIPRHIAIRGADIRGEYTLALTKLYSLTFVDPAAFAIPIPGHFRVQRLAGSE
ncbi:MAG: hypothetical protein CSA33_08300 [Desulfobulbus propionicus]|nr:MAG: hypothetical protein CSA33_08300 [Desulfobulbus propionicus]